jgi:hypothetical protein
MISEEEIKKIYREAQEDETLLSKIDAKQLLMAYENQKNDYLDGKTNMDIATEIVGSFEQLEDVSKKEKRSFAESLSGYRYVDEIDQLHVGKYVRWIQKYAEQVKLANGGILLSIEAGNEGMYMKVRLNNFKLINVSFDMCLIYQKLSVGEQLVLMVADYAVK